MLVTDWYLYKFINYTIWYLLFFLKRNDSELEHVVLLNKNGFCLSFNF